MKPQHDAEMAQFQADLIASVREMNARLAAPDNSNAMPHASTPRKFLIPTAEEDALIQAGIAADADTVEVSDAAFSAPRRIGRPPKHTPKIPTTIRFDADV